MTRALKIFSADGEDLLAILEWDGALTAKFAHSSLTMLDFRRSWYCRKRRVVLQ